MASIPSNSASNRHVSLTSNTRFANASSSHSRLKLLLVLIASSFIVPSAPLALGIHAASIAHHASSTKLHSAAASPDWKNAEYGSSSLSSKLLYNYVDPLLDIASKRTLQPSDAFLIPKEKSMGESVSRLESIYNQCRDNMGRKSKTATLARALLQSQKQTLILTGILRLANTIVQAFPSLLIARLLRQIEAGNALTLSKPLRSAVLLVSVLSLKMIIENQYFHGCVKCASEVRGSVGGLIFDKSLRLSSGAAVDGNRTLGSGEVVNLMQSDATTLEMLMLQAHTTWDGLLQIGIYITLLYRYLGPSVLWGLGVLLTTIPINALTLRILNRLNKRELEAKDARMKKTTESIGNMQLLKLMGWESLFANDVQTQREEELRRHTKRGAVRALSQAISNTAPTISLVATLSAYAKTGKPVVASTIFTAISLFNQLRFPLFFYPMLIDSLANGRNSLKRISSYLESEEITPYVECKPKLDGVGGSIEMSNGNFLWSTAAKHDCNDTDVNAEKKTGCVRALCDASISVQPGEIVAVVGGVGSGKSALVKSLIGELVPIPKNPKLIRQEYGSTADVPRVTAIGSIAYCSQEAWLPKGTIRESVVFGREYNEEKYLRAIYTAGLDEDIVSDHSGVSAEMAKSKGLLTHETDVGEDGSNLSGGQRARVALARAFYEEDAGVYVLDDVLSALDASVGSTVFQRVSERLRGEKAATVFVTNDPNLPRQCDKVVFMGSDPITGCSKIIDVGTYDELLERGHDLRTITHPEVNGEEGKEKNSVTNESGPGVDISIAFEHAQQPIMHIAENSTASSPDCHADPDCKVSLEEDPALLAEHTYPQSIESNEDTLPSSNEQQRQLSTDDTMATGSVPGRTYFTYLKSVKHPLLLVIALASYFASNGSQFFQQLVIAKWTESSAGGAITEAVSSKYCRQLVRAAFGVSASMYLRSFLTMKVGVRASKTIHQAMLKSVFGAPISFFSSTPSGQLLTRFGRELEVVDRSLPDGIQSVLYCFLQVFFSGLALA